MYSSSQAYFPAAQLACSLWRLTIINSKLSKVKHIWQAYRHIKILKVVLTEGELIYKLNNCACTKICYFLKLRSSNNAAIVYTNTNRSCQDKFP